MRALTPGERDAAWAAASVLLAFAALAAVALCALGEPRRDGWRPDDPCREWATRVPRK